MSIPTLDDLLARAVSDQVPGASAAVVIDGRLAWQGAAGLADVEAGIRLTPAQPLAVGSITKTFVATLVLDLIESGALALTDTVDTILHETVDGVANTNATLAELMNHTSGIPSWEDETDWIAAARGANCEAQPIWHKAEPLDYIKGRPAIAPPGQTYAYSNSNYTLLGLIIEAVTGAEATDHMRRRILHPLDLASAYVDSFETPPRPCGVRRYHLATPAFRRTAGLAPCFISQDGDLIDTSAVNLSSEWMAGGLVAATSDIARFGSALLVERRLLSAEALRSMQSWRPIDGERAVGFGLFRTERKDEPALIGHDGAVLGSTASFAWIEGTPIVVASAANCGVIHSGEIPRGVMLARDPRFLAAVRDAFSV